jgi:hypothetical protein
MDDETCVNQHYSPSKTWQDSTDRGGLKVPIGKGEIVIVCHIRSSEISSLKGSKLLFGPRKNPQIQITTVI